MIITFSTHTKFNSIVKRLIPLKFKEFSNLTIFDKIVNKEIKADIVFEDNEILAFKDINPVAPIHILIIPKVKDGLSGISKAEERNVNILGRLLLTAKKIGDQLNIKDGYRLVINEGANGGQTVYHVHIHFLAGKQFESPGKEKSSNENKLI